MKKLFIIRGVPGSGKTTFAEAICKKFVSADDYFMSGNEYKFDITKLESAHRYCYGKTKSIMETDEDVAVNNTFTRNWEMKPYFELAKQFNYMVFSIIVENRHGNKSIHDIPDKIIDNMKNRFNLKLI